MRISVQIRWLFLVLVSGALFAQTTNMVVKAKIEIEEVGENIEIRGIAKNLSNCTQIFSSKLSIIKKKNGIINPMLLRKDFFL